MDYVSRLFNESLILIFLPALWKFNSFPLDSGQAAVFVMSSHLLFSHLTWLVTRPYFLHSCTWKMATFVTSFTVRRRVLRSEAAANRRIVLVNKQTGKNIKYNGASAHERRYWAVNFGTRLRRATREFSRHVRDAEVSSAWNMIII